MRVLVVDDEPALLEIAQEYLESIWGFEVIVRESAKGALEALRDERVDGIVSDYDMPGMDGLGLLDEIRGSGSGVPFIMLTGKGREELVIEAFHKGCDDYIQKGGDPRSQFAVLAQSITNKVESERAKEALRRSTERFQFASEATEDGIFDYDTRRDELFTTSRFRGILGLPDDASITIDGWKSMIHPDDVKWVMNEIDEQFERDGRYSIEYRINTANGREVWVRDRAKAVFVDDTGATLRIVGSMTDVSDRRGLGMRFERHERLLTRSITTVPEMISIHDTDMGLLYCNWNGVADIPLERRVIGEKCYKVLRGRDDVCEGCSALNVLETGHEHYSCKVGDGRVHDIRIVPLFDSEGRMEGFVKSVMDLTELYRALEEERSSRETLQKLMDGVPDIIDIQDPDQRVIMYNRTGLDRFGIEAEDLDGRRCYEFLGRDRPCDICATAMAKERGELVRLRKEIPELGGIFECTSNPIFDDEGALVNIIEELRDVSSEERMAAEMRRAERRYGNLFRYSGDGLALHDSAGVILEVNDRLVDMCGVPRERLVGMHLNDLFIESVGSEEETIRAVVQKGHHTMASDLIAGDGRLIPAEVDSSIADPDEGTIHGFIRDVSERHRNERALLNANRKLNLLSSVTRHDVLNRITALRGYTQLIRNAPDDRRERYLSRIDDIIDDITGQIRFTGEYQDMGLAEPQWMDLAATVEAASCSVPADVETDVREWDVYADPLLGKVFINLFENSVRHNDENVRIRVTSRVDGDDLLTMVEDDGRGIPMEEKNMVFERGYGKNTGFGLFLCQEILMVTGIAISEEGEFGRGARFVIRFPMGTYR